MEKQRYPRAQRCFPKKLQDMSKLNFKLLLIEYEQCLDNYSYRDQLAIHEFYYAIITVGAIVSIIETLGDKIGLFGTIIIFIVGWFALFIIHFDLMSIVSSKKACIDRALEIEDYLNTNLRNHNNKEALQLIHKIGNRKKHLFEKIPFLKSSYLMILFIRILMVVWVVYGILLYK